MIVNESDLGTTQVTLQAIGALNVQKQVLSFPRADDLKESFGFALFDGAVYRAKVFAQHIGDVLIAAEKVQRFEQAAR